MTVNFRSHRPDYRAKKMIVPESERMIFANTHEAIVDAATWEAAQQVWGKGGRRSTRKTPNLFAGIIIYLHLLRQGHDPALQHPGQSRSYRRQPFPLQERHPKSMQNIEDTLRHTFGDLFNNGLFVQIQQDVLSDSRIHANRSRHIASPKKETLQHLDNPDR